MIDVIALFFLALFILVVAIFLIMHLTQKVIARRAVARALRLAHERSVQGLQSDLYNCSMRGKTERLRMCLDAFFLRRAAALRGEATFAICNGVPESPSLFDIDFLTPRKRVCCLSNISMEQDNVDLSRTELFTFGGSNRLGCLLSITD